MAWFKWFKSVDVTEAEKAKALAMAMAMFDDPPPPRRATGRPRVVPISQDREAKMAGMRFMTRHRDGCGIWTELPLSIADIGTLAALCEWPTECK